MGLEELLNSLKKNEQKQIEDIWEQARAEAETIRKQAEETIAALTREHEDSLAAACRKSVKAILAESSSTARKRMLYTYQGLNENLRRTSAGLLPELRQHDYENVFARLVKELPGLEWEKIMVNPADLDLAGKFFPRDIIRPDASVSGGLIVASTGNRIVVDNSFEKRLENRWPQILPELIKDIEKRYVKSRPAEKTN